MPHPKFEIVRRLYRYTCGYCGLTETDAGSEMTLDHFMPRVAGGNIAELQKTIAAQEHYLAALQAQIDQLRATR